MTDPHTRIRQAIRDALQSGPKNTPELVKATGYDGQMMGNHLKMLLRQGDISRVETTKGRYRYYIGLTAPNYQGYVPAVRNPDVPRLTSKIQYAVPIRRVTFDMGVSVTLPAFPWELNSPTQGACDPAQPGNPTGTRSDVTTVDPLTTPGALNQPPVTQEATR